MVARELCIGMLVALALTSTACGSDGLCDDPEEADAQFCRDPATADEARLIHAGISASLDAVRAQVPDPPQMLAAPCTPYADEMPLTGEQACPLSGRVTYTGNADVYVTDACDSGANVIAKFQYGDLVNNLNDCQVGEDLYVDGNLNLLLLVMNDDQDVSLNGTLEIARRGPAGGLIPLRDCSIFLHGDATTLTGTVCGEQVP